MTVTTTSDSSTAGDGACSLREAIASVSSGTATADCGPLGNGTTPITLPAGDYDLTAGELEIGASANLAITGANPNDPTQTVIDAQGQSRVLEVAAGAHATLSGVELTGGRTANGGDATGSFQPGGSSDPAGGIFNHGTLTLDHSLVTGNGTGNGGKGSDGAATNTNARNPGSGGQSGIGGGIYNDTNANLVVQNSTISDNTTGAGGPGGNAAMGVQGLGNIPGGADGGNGGDPGDAGGIYNGGTATITNTTVSGNFTGRGGNGGDGGAGASETANNPAGKGGDGGAAEGGGYNYSSDGPFLFVAGGGGIYNAGTLTMTASTLSGNGLGAGGTGGSAGAGGSGGTNSFADGGRGGYGGPGGLGAALLSDTGAAALTNVTISGNTTGQGGTGGGGPQAGACCGGGAGGYGGYGGGIWANNSVGLTQVTISQNSLGAGGLGGAAGASVDGNGNAEVGAPGPNGAGAGIDANSSGVTETNTIVAANGNPASDANCIGDIQDGLHNIVYPDASCPGTRADPLLGSLGDNGGPTETMLPGTGSSAINNVPLPACTVTTDQRGYTRPGQSKSSCDSGAVETGGAPPKTSTSTALQSSANPSTPGQQVMYTATVSPVPDGGTMAFTDGGSTITGCGSVAVDTTTGEATCSVTYASAGSHSIQATYSGDTNFSGSPSTTLSQTVGTTTTTALQSSANPSTIGQQVMYTATVSPVPDGGTMAFTDGGSTITGCGSVAVDTTTGEATCSVTYASGGSHSIQATYSGDTNFGGSPSPTLSQVVQTSTSTAVSSSANPSTAGQQVTFTATVSPAPDGGTVSFTDDGTTIPGCAAAALSGGQATCPVTFSAAATHSIVATYSGDTSFAGSTSSTLSQAVQAAASSGGGSPGSGGTGGAGGGGTGGSGTSAHTAIGHITTAGNAATVALTCTGPAGSNCSLKVIFSATETFNGSKLLAIAARKAKKHKKTVILGTVTITLPAGETKNVTISLNGAGKRLLSKRHKLRVSLVVSQTVNGRVTTVAKKAVGFKAKKQKR